MSGPLYLSWQYLIRHPAKTATLVARILSWCLGPGWERAADALGAASPEAPVAPDAVAPEQIAARVLEGVVAITFTEAAASEMAERVAALAS